MNSSTQSINSTNPTHSNESRQPSVSGQSNLPPKKSSFGGTVGHLWLDSYILSSIIQLATQRFCKKFLTPACDPKGRQFDQMTQAARSVVANIAEGSARHFTSSETEMKLTDVARASLAELASDYTNWLMQDKRIPWAKDFPEAREILDLRLDKPNYEWSDPVHASCHHILTQQEKFSHWLESSNDEIVANALLLLIGRVANMLNKQLEAQHTRFENEGGFREKLSVTRTQARAKAEDAPACSDCGKPMKKRTSARGEFWGCTGYPECRSIKPISTNPINSTNPTHSNESSQSSLSSKSPNLPTQINTGRL